VEGFVVDAIAAVLATIASGPMNYARNMIYSTPPGTAPKTSVQHLVILYKEVLNEGSLWCQGRVLQQRLRIGWGTARVAVGMAAGSHLYGTALQAAERAGM